MVKRALRQDRQHRVGICDERRRYVGNVLYGTTKAGVVALTKGLGRELAPHGINVNAIAPGVVETSMTNSLLTPERRKTVVAAIPLGRMGSTDDIARVVAMLASDLFGYIAAKRSRWTVVT